MRNTVLETFKTGKSYYQAEAKLPFDIDGKIKELSLFVSTTTIEISRVPMVLVSLEDITERKKVEEALRESEEHYRMLAETMNDGLGVIDEKGTYVYVNNKFGEILGYSPDEIVGGHWTAFFDEDAQKIINEQLIERKKGVAKPYELINTRKDGQKIFIRISPQAIFDEDGKFKGSFAVMTDITERKQTEEKIQKSEEKYRGIFDESIASVYVFDAKKNFIDSNQAGLDLLGYSREKLLNMSIPDVDANPVVVLPAHEKLLSGERIINYEHQLRHKDGRIISVLNNSRPLTDADGNVIGMQSTLIDITERNKAEERLLEHQTKLKAMASEMLLTEERERQRLAVGLHDEVCQKLVLTKLALESSLNLVSDSNVLASLRIACGAIGETIEQADSLTFELSNPVLRQLGFVVALEKYLTEEIRQKYGVAYELQSDEQLSTLPDEIKNCLFRVTRELLTNVVKHAQARKVKVSARES